MDLQKFQHILRMTEEDLYEYLKIVLHKRYDKVIYGGDWLYAEGDIPIMVEAHLDTVHANLPSQIFYDDKEQIMWSPQGIGGDDRCGVVAILEMIQEHKPHVLFCKQEERGCVGARECIKTLVPENLHFIIGLDRRGKDDCVFYECDNKKFQEHMASFGFKLAIGSCSDISVLAPKWNCAAVNFSVGYFCEHTLNEHIHIPSLDATIEKCKNILKTPSEKKWTFDRKAAYVYTAPKTTGTSRTGYFGSDNYQKPANKSPIPAKKFVVTEDLQLQAYY